MSLIQMRKVNDDWIEQSSDLQRDYLEALILFRAAPTLFGLKPSTLLNLSNNCFNLKAAWEEHKYSFIKSCNKLFSIDWLQIKETSTSSLVLFYQPGLIEKATNLSDNQIFLNNCGYQNFRSSQDYLSILIDRFKKEQFPHEIGIFLGIPVLDVVEFIKNQGKRYLLNGYWKVYYNPEHALEVFNNYRSAQVEMLKFIKDTYQNHVVESLIN